MDKEQIEELRRLSHLPNYGWDNQIKPNEPAHAWYFYPLSAIYFFIAFILFEYVLQILLT